MAFARDVVEQVDGRLLCTDTHWKGAGLPISLDRGFRPDHLAEIEAQALASAEDAAVAAFGHVMPDRTDR